jgi:glycosyltransferase involved in cell wall biosynthesis
MKQKILYVITKSNWGGAQRYVYDLAVNMPKSQFDAVVAAGGNGALFEKLRAAGIRTHTIPGSQRNINPMKELQAFIALLQIYRRENPDIIHLNSTKMGILGGIAALCARTFRIHPLTIYTVHGWAFHEDRPRSMRLFIYMIERLGALLHAKIIVISTHDYRAARRFLPQRKLALIPHGIENSPLLLREEARDALSIHIGKNIAPGAVLIGTIAELTKNKGIPYFLLALRTVQNRTPDVPIHGIIIGEGPDRTLLESLIRTHGLSHTVTLAGFIPDAWKYLNAFDMVVMPSVKEGLPYTLMEAMKAGVPAVAASSGGIPDLIRHQKTGLLVPPKDAQALAHSIHRLIKHPHLCTSLGNASKQSLALNFSFNRMITHTIQIYNSRHSAHNPSRRSLSRRSASPNKNGWTQVRIKSQYHESSRTHQ